MSRKNLGILYGLLGVVLFSSKAVLVKLAYAHGADTLDLLLLRMLFSFPFYVAILIVVTKKNPGNKPSKKDFAWLVVFGFLGYYLASYFDLLGLNHIKAGLERIVLFVYPTFVVLLNWMFFKQRIDRVLVLAIAITYLGVLVTFWDALDTSGERVTLGVVLVLLSALTYASYIVGSGWLIPKFGVLKFTCCAMIVSTVCVVAHYLVRGNWQGFDYPLAVYLYGLAMALLATLLPSFLVSASIERLGASNFSILGSLGPVSTIGLAFVFLGENLSFWQLFGMLMVVFGVSYLSVKLKKPSKD